MSNKPVKCEGVGLRIGNEVVVETIYDDIKPAKVNGTVSDHIFLTLLDEEMGAIKLDDSFEQEVVLDPQYSDISDFVDGIAIVSIGSPRHRPLYGLIDSNLYVIISCKYEKITRLQNGFFELLDSDGKYGVANSEGILFDCKYKSIEYNPETNKFELQLL